MPWRSRGWQAWLYLSNLTRVVNERLGHCPGLDSDSDSSSTTWLSRLPKLSCNLARESRRFDWLGQARLGSAQPCEPQPNASPGAVQHRTRSTPPRSRHAPPLQPQLREPPHY